MLRNMLGNVSLIPKQDISELPEILEIGILGRVIAALLYVELLMHLCARLNLWCIDSACQDKLVYSLQADRALFILFPDKN